MMLEISAALQIDGWMTEDELEWLHDQAAQFDSVLEIGTWKGRSTAALASGCTGQVVTVDRFGGPLYETSTYAEAQHIDIFAEAHANLDSFTNVTILKMSSREAAESLAGQSFEMVFIDGDHAEEAVLEDLAVAMVFSPKMLAGHDRQLPGVAAAIERLNTSEGPDSIWWVMNDQ